MNFRRKSVLAGGLGALAASVWVPQLLSLEADPKSLSQESPAETAPEGRSETEHVASEESAPAGVLEQLGSLEEDLAQLEAMRGTSDLEALLARLETGSRTEESAPPLEADSFAPAPEDPRAELEAFSDRNPLLGLIHGSDRSVALLGHRVVRTGDVLAGGRITVGAIGPGSVELTAGSAHLVVELPAFQARGAGVLPIQSSPPIAPRPTTSSPSAQGGGA